MTVDLISKKQSEILLFVNKYVKSMKNKINVANSAICYFHNYGDYLSSSYLKLKFYGYKYLIKFIINFLKNLYSTSEVENYVGLFIVVYILVAILALCIFFILPLKKLFNRDRPTRILSVYRICNMRDLEHGKAMPSGDAAAGAFFCGIYAYLFGLPFYAWAIFTILVSLGRVYVHCHWIGDTIAG